MFMHLSVHYFNQTLHEGQILGMILADNLATARRAASLVRVEYEELKPIITIQVRAVGAG